ncbi:MAG: DUF305 domain-containing protein [Methylocella sp.]
MLVAAPALAFAQNAQPDSMHGMDMKGTISPATKDYIQSMQGMQDAMKGMTPTNDPNKDFVMMMKPHHQAAVEMAEIYLKYGTDPMLTKMAKDIISSQKKEIAEMNAWQAAHAK